MKGDNLYVMYLSFYEFNVKAQLENADLMVFFNLSHPGKMNPVNVNEYASTIMYLECANLIDGYLLILITRKSSTQLERCIYCLL